MYELYVYVHVCVYVCIHIYTNIYTHTDEDDSNNSTQSTVGSGITVPKPPVEFTGYCI